MNELVKEQSREDKIRISEDVIATIAGIAASENENVVSLGGGFVDGIAGMLGRKSPSKGIKVELKENQVAIDLSAVMQYGCKIHEVARNMQSRIREAVGDMTGLEVVSVNISVIGIVTDKESVRLEAAKLEAVDELPPQA